MTTRHVEVGRLDELDDPGCREFVIGEGDWPLRGFVVRQGGEVFAYQNVCVHVGHPLNWSPDRFLSKDKTLIVCSSHGATYDIASGKCIGGPGTGRSLQRVDVVVREGMVFVSGPDQRT